MSATAEPGERYGGRRMVERGALGLAPDLVLAHYRELVTHFCCADGIRGNLEKFFEYLSTLLPCTRMACVVIDRDNRHVVPLGVWTASPELRITASRPARMPSLETLEAAIGFSPLSLNRKRAAKSTWAANRRCGNGGV